MCSFAQNFRLTGEGLLCTMCTNYRLKMWSFASAQKKITRCVLKEGLILPNLIQWMWDFSITLRQLLISMASPWSLIFGRFFLWSIPSLRKLQLFYVALGAGFFFTIHRAFVLRHHIPKSCAGCRCAFFVATQNNEFNSYNLNSISDRRERTRTPTTRKGSAMHFDRISTSHRVIRKRHQYRMHTTWSSRTFSDLPFCIRSSTECTERGLCLYRLNLAAQCQQ